MPGTEPAALFMLVVHRRTAAFGESRASEAAEVANLLHRAAHLVKSGVPIGRPDQRQLKCSSGQTVGGFEFFEGMLKRE